MKSSSHQTNVAPPDHLRTMASVTKDDDESEVTTDETETTVDSSSASFYPSTRRIGADADLTSSCNHSSETVARKEHTKTKRLTDPGCHPVDGRQSKVTEEEVNAKTKKRTSYLLPGAYCKRPGQVSLRPGAPNKSALAQVSGVPKLQHCSSSSSSSSSTATPPDKKIFLLPEAIPITAEVVEAEEDQERKSNIRTTIFHQEVIQQRDYYETKLAALAAKLEAAERSKESELEALEEENGALRAENLKLKVAAGIQATIFQQEQQQRRDYYESQMERAHQEAQKLKRTLRKQKEHEQVIRAREIDQARQKVYALQAKWEYKMAAMEQAQQAALQGVMFAKDQELDQAEKVIAQLRHQLGLPSAPNGDEQTPIMLNNAWQ